MLYSTHKTSLGAPGLVLPLRPLRSTAEVFVWPCLLWWAVLSRCSQRRIDGVAVWHVRECCDVLRSPPGQQGDRGPFSTTASAVTLMKDGLALVWSECFIMVMHGAAGQAPALGRVCVHLCGSLAKCFPSVKCLYCSLFLSAGSTSQRRWFALFPKFHLWLHGESVIKVELFMLTLTFKYTWWKTKERATFTVHNVTL